MGSEYGSVTPRVHPRKRLPTLAETRFLATAYLAEGAAPRHKQRPRRDMCPNGAVSVVISGRAAQVVELRFFGGLKLEEIAEVLSVSVASVDRDWRAARAFLTAELRG